MVAHTSPVVVTLLVELRGTSDGRREMVSRLPLMMVGAETRLSREREKALLRLGDSDGNGLFKVATVVLRTP